MQEGDPQSRIVGGTLKDMYDVSLSSPEWKKSLIALGLTMPQAEVGFSPTASDVRAVFRTQAERDCVATIPAGQVRFGIASTEGAIGYLRLSPRGDATYLDVACGIQLLIIATPRDPLDASSISIWSHRDLDVKYLDRARYRLELVYLRPGDRL